MIYINNIYKNSKKEFKKFIKKNPFCTQSQWDDYAMENDLYSAFTLKCHFISDITWKELLDNNKDTFEYLKSIFIILPKKQKISQN